MKIVLLTFLLITLISVNSYTIEEHVIKLGADDFDQAIAQFDNILIKFYAPWCGHCQHLAPVYVETATALQGTPYKIAQIDCTVHGTVCQKYGIRGYPTVKLFSKGRQPIDYSGSRQKTAFIQWFKKNAIGVAVEDAGLVVVQQSEQKSDQHQSQDKGQTAQQQAKEQQEEGGIKEQNHVLILNSKNFDEVLNTYTNIFIKFYAPWCGHCKNLAPTFQQVATALAESGSSNRLAKVDCTVNGDICQKYGIRGYPTMKLFSKGLNPRDYASHRDKDSILNFVNGNAIPEPVETPTVDPTVVDETVEKLNEL